MSAAACDPRMKGEPVSSQPFPTPEKIQGTARRRGGGSLALDKAPMTRTSWGSSSSGQTSCCPSRCSVRGHSTGPGMEPLEIFPAEEVFIPLDYLAAAMGYKFEDESTRRAFSSVARGLSLCQLRPQALLVCKYPRSSDSFSDLSFALTRRLCQSMNKTESQAVKHIPVYRVVWPVNPTLRSHGFPRAIWAHLS